MLDLSQRVLIHFVIQVWYCSRGNRSKTALRACSSAGLKEVSSLCLVFLLSSDDPWRRDRRDPVAVEPLLCPSMFHDLVESGLQGPEAAFVSQEVTRATKLATICSIFVILVVWAVTVWASVWTQFPILAAFCMKGGVSVNRFHCFSDPSYLREILFLLRSGREPLGEPIFEEEAGAGDVGTFVPSLTRAIRKDGKRQNWVVDIWTRQNQTVTTPCTFEQELDRAKTTGSWSFF